MSMEIPKSAGESGPKEPIRRQVSELEVGDLVVANAEIDTITSKMRSATGITLNLKSGKFLRFDSEREDVEVPE